jgi:hypothetical protein
MIPRGTSGLIIRHARRISLRPPWSPAQGTSLAAGAEGQTSRSALGAERHALPHGQEGLGLRLRNGLQGPPQLLMNSPTRSAHSLEASLHALLPLDISPVCFYVYL